MEIKLAANAAVVAGGTHMTGFPWPYLIAALPFNESRNRTCLDTLPAENTIRALQVVIAHCYNFSFGPPETVCDGVVYLNCVAGLNATTAKDAPRKISDD